MNTKLANVLALVAQIAGYFQTAIGALPPLATKVSSICTATAKFIDSCEPIVVQVFPAAQQFLDELKTALTFVATHGPEIAADLEHVPALLAALNFTTLTPVPADPPKAA